MDQKFQPGFGGLRFAVHTQFDLRRAAAFPPGCQTSGKTGNAIDFRKN
jgi:hypothetical protein